jgi:hypothetical protein
LFKHKNVLPPNNCNWVSSEWSECDPKTNTQKRKLTCVNPDKSNCDQCIQSEKPDISQNCITMAFCCDSTMETGTGCTQNKNGCDNLTPIQKCSDCKKTTWPSNVYFFSPTDTNIQSDIYEVFSKQGGIKPENNGQFSMFNYALLFMPGTYNNIDIPIGYYTHVAGLGRKISDVVLDGNGPHVDNSSDNYMVGSLNNFWRSCENMTVNNPSDGNTNKGILIWSVSQAASMRSVQINGDLQLFAVEEDKGGYASGGYVSNVKANDVMSGSQQQFICRNLSINSFKSPLWNQVLVGCDLDIPAVECCLKEGSAKTLLVVDKTPVISEKPYLVATDPTKKYVLSIIKPPRVINSSGFLQTPVNGSIEIKEDGYFIATPGTTSSIINKQLSNNKDIIFCPGIYNLDDTLILKGQLLFGLGIPRIISNSKKDIVSGYGDICGIIFEAAEGSNNTTILVNMNQNNPSNLWDVYCRVGGGLDETKSYSADKMLYVGGKDSIVDNCWCWVADHYASSNYTGWDKAACSVGVHIDGDNVVCYGMFAEHNHDVNLYWSGDFGEMYMFQSEFNYFPESKKSFNNSVSYHVDTSVTKHTIRGAGAYCFFPCSSSSKTDIYALAGFMFPSSDVVDYKTIFTVYLNGYGGINNVIVDENGKGDNYVVKWVSNGLTASNTKCSPSFSRPVGNTMLQYRCSKDNKNPCSCSDCKSPSTCVGGNCIPLGGCTDSQKKQINKKCGVNGCACGSEDAMWKCTTNPAGCYSDQNMAKGQCSSNNNNNNNNNTCKWWN